MKFLDEFFRREARTGTTAGVQPTGSNVAGGFRAVSIRPGDDSCEAAKQFGRIRFLCAKAPRLPLPECNAATCNCRYVHYADRRSGQDRRATYDWARERDLDVVNRRSGRGRRATDAVV